MVLVRSCVLVLTLSLPAVAVAGPILVPPAGATDQILFFSPLGETFTAQDSGIASIGFWVTDMNPITSPDDLSLEIRLFADVGFGGPLLASGVFTGLVAGFDGYADVNFLGTPLVVGSVYSAQLIDATPRWGVAQGSPIYPGSEAIISGGADPTFNWAFRVNPSEPVPEPSALALLGTALLGLGVMRWFIWKQRANRQNHIEDLEH
jgi:hypothetical protein